MARKRYDDIVNEILRKLDSPDPKAARRSAEAAMNMALASGDGPLRQRYLAKAQKYIARMDPEEEAEDIQELQGHVLALQGRGGDTRIAHVTPGELVIPKAMQTPEVAAALVRAAKQAGLDPRRFRVGQGRVNPRTGQEEFSVRDDVWGWRMPGEPNDIEEIVVAGRSSTPQALIDLSQLSNLAPTSFTNVAYTAPPGPPTEEIVVTTPPESGDDPARNPTSGPWGSAPMIPNLASPIPGYNQAGKDAFKTQGKILIRNFLPRLRKLPDSFFGMPDAKTRKPDGK